MYLFILAGLWRLQSYEEGKTGSGDKLPIVESFFFFLMPLFVCLFVCFASPDFSCELLLGACGI